MAKGGSMKGTKGMAKGGSMKGTKGMAKGGKTTKYMAKGGALVAKERAQGFGSMGSEVARKIGMSAGASPVAGGVLGAVGKGAKKIGKKLTQLKK